MKTPLALLCLAALASTARAEFYSGNELLALMQSELAAQRAAAMAYVMGVHDATTGDLHCVAGNATGQQLNDVVRQTLQALPERRQMSADVIVVASLAVAFPCKKKAPAGSKTL